MNCRGIETRKRIVEQYDLKLIAHTRLLNGQTKRSDAEAELKDQYYVFQYIKKNDTKIRGSILCGTGAAKHLLELTGEDNKPLFDPLTTIGTGGAGGGSGTGTPKNKWNEETLQLHNAIQWLIIYWDILSPDGPILDIKEKLECHYNKRPFLSQIKAINTIISKNDKTLTEIIDSFRAKNDIKKYSFDLLVARLANEGIKSNF